MARDDGRRAAPVRTQGQYIVYSADLGGGSVRDTHNRGGGQRSMWRLATAGALVALACLLAGWALESLRFGWTDGAATARVEREVRRRLDEMTASLSSVAAAVAGQPDLVRAAADDSEAARRLFDLLADTVARMAPAQAAAIQAALRAEYPLLPYVVGAAAISLATAVLGQIIFNRKADQFAEQG